MFDNTKAYFIENVLIPFNDYLRIKKSSKSGLSLDLRKAITVATNLYHLRENLPTEIKKSRKEQSELCIDYDLLGDIVNASKHRLINQNSPQISDSKNIYEQISITEYKDKDGIYHIVEKSVFAKLDNGIERDLHEILINVMNMWLIELEKYDIIESHIPFQVRSSLIPKRRKKTGKLDLTIMRNLRFAQKYKIQKYNYETKSIEPVDLTNTNVSFNIYEPQYIADLEITDKSGNQNKLEIKLTNKQKQVAEKIKDENEKFQFLLKLAEEQKLITIKK